MCVQVCVCVAFLMCVNKPQLCKTLKSASEKEGFLFSVCTRVRVCVCNTSLMFHEMCVCSV